MTLTFNPQLENASLNAIRDAIDSGDGQGSIELYAGAALIASLELPKPSFSNESSGQSFLTSPAQGVAIAAGQPDSFKFATSYGATVFTGAVPSDLTVDFTPSGAAVVASFTLEAGVVQARQFASTVLYPYQPAPVPPPTDWGPLLRGLNSGSLAGNSSSVATDGAGVWIFGFAGGYAARSEDNGATWAALPQGLNSGGTTSIKSIATDGNGVWVAGSGHAARSTDNGATWAALPQGLNSGGITSIESIATDGNGVWVAVLIGGYASRSTDNGATWSPLVRSLNSGSPNQSAFSVETNGAGVWVAGFEAGWAARSTDNGATWAALPQGFGVVSPPQRIADLSADGNVWVAVMPSGKAARSTNGGVDWGILPDNLNSGASGSAFLAVTNDESGNWVATDAGGYAAYSDDGGATWGPLVKGLNSGNTAASVNCIAFGGSIWMVGLDSGYAAISPPLEG